MAVRGLRQKVTSNGCPPWVQTIGDLLDHEVVVWAVQLPVPRWMVGREHHGALWRQDPVKFCERFGPVSQVVQHQRCHHQVTLASAAKVSGPATSPRSAIVACRARLLDLAWPGSLPG